MRYLARRIFTVGLVVLLSWEGGRRSCFSQSQLEQVVDVVLLIDTSLSMPIGDSREPLRKQEREGRFAVWLKKRFDAGLYAARPEKNFDDLLRYELRLNNDNRMGEFEQFRLAEWKRFKQALHAFIEQGLLPNSTVTIIPFGDDPTANGAAGRDSQQWTARVGDAAECEAILTKLDGLESKAQHTYITWGMRLAQEAVAEQKRLSPAHARQVVLITDGDDNPPTAAELLVHQVDALKADQARRSICSGKDFFLWYAHFGPVARQVEAAVQRLDGRSVAITDLHFGQVTLFTAVVSLPVQPPPESAPAGWAHLFPEPEPFRLGQRFWISPRNCQGLLLEFGPPDLERQLPSGEWTRVESGAGNALLRIETDPPQLNLGSEPMSVRLEITGKNLPTGTYRARLDARVPAGLVLSNPQFLWIDFRVAPPPDLPKIAVRPRDRLSFGAGDGAGVVTLATPAIGEVTLEPDPAARRINPAPRARAALVLKTPVPGLNVSIAQGSGDPQPLAPLGAPEFAGRGWLAPEPFSIDGEQKLTVRISLDPNSKAVPGEVTGELLLRPEGEGYAFAPPNRNVAPGTAPNDKRLDVQLNIKPISIAIDAGKSEIDFGVASTARWNVPPPRPPLPVGVELDVEFGQPAAGGAGPPLRVTPPTARLSRAAPAIPIEVVIERWVSGTWDYKVPVRSTHPLIAVEPSALDLRAKLAHLGVRLKKYQSQFEVKPDESHGRMPLDEQVVTVGSPELELIIEGMAQPAASLAALPALRPFAAKRLQPEESAAAKEESPPPLVEAELAAPSGGRAQVLRLTGIKPRDGRWVYRIPLEVDDPRFVLEPAAAEIAVEYQGFGAELPLEWTQPPPHFLTEHTRVWPFEARVCLPDRLKGPPEEFLFKLTFPDQPGPIEVGAVAAKDSPTDLVLRSPEELPPLREIPLEGESVRDAELRVDLTRRGKMLATWKYPLVVLPVIVQPPEFRRVVERGEEERLLIKDFVVTVDFPATATNPLRLEAISRLRQVTAIVLQVKRRGLIIYDDPTRELGGRAATEQQIHDLREMAAANQTSGNSADGLHNRTFRCVMLGLTAGSRRISDLLVFQPRQHHWWFKSDERFVSCCVAEYVEYVAKGIRGESAPAEEWAPVHAVQVCFPAYTPALRQVVEYMLWATLWVTVVAAIVAAVGGVVFWILWRRCQEILARLPTWEQLDLSVSPLQEDDVRFHPQNPTGQAGFNDWQPTTHWQRVLAMIEPRKIRSTAVIPLTFDEDLVSHPLGEAAQRLDIALGPEGFEVRSGRGCSIDGQEEAAGNWTVLDLYASIEPPPQLVEAQLHLQFPQNGLPAAAEPPPGDEEPALTPVAGTTLHLCWNKVARREPPPNAAPRAFWSTVAGWFTRKRDEEEGPSQE